MLGLDDGGWGMDSEEIPDDLWSGFFITELSGESVTLTQKSAYLGSEMAEKCRCAQARRDIFN